MQPASDRRPSNSSWVNFDQPFEGFTVDRSLLDEPLRQSPTSFWLPPTRPASVSVRKSAKPSRVGWVVRRLTLGCSLAVLSLGLFMGFTAYRLSQVSQQVFRGGSVLAYALQDDLDPSGLTREGDSRVNLLLAGKGGPGHEGPNLTDSIIVVSLDPNSQSAVFLSLPRDWQIELSSHPGIWVRINAVYALARENHFHQTADREAAEAAGLQALERGYRAKVGAANSLPCLD